MITPRKINHKIALLIFACNEASVIAETIQSCLKNLRSEDALFVIADNCTDETAIIARTLGARVFERRNDHQRGKSAAISWFMIEKWNEISPFDYAVILDADSLLPDDFITSLEPGLNEKVLVGQTYLMPLGYESTPLSTLIALSELLEQTVFDRIRLFFGCSVRLRGTGMVFKPRLLLDMCNEIGTDVEDTVFSLFLAEQRIFVHALSSAKIFDPKPDELNSASRQRARWFRGQMTAFWKYRRDVWNTFFSGANGLSVLSSIFLKPRWLKMIVKICLTLVFFKIPVLFYLFGLSFLVESLAILIGIFCLPNRWQFLKSLLYMPEFLLMWLIGIKLSWKKTPWLRVRQLPTAISSYEINADGSIVTTKRIK